MNRLPEIRELLAYHRWANDAMLDAAAALSSYDVTRDLKSSFPSIRDTLAHLLSAEWAWLERLGGRSPEAMPQAWRELDVGGIRAQWRPVGEKLDRFAAGLLDGDLDRPIDYRNLAGQAHTSTVGQILRHVVNHGTYHRGQLATMLRQLGVAPPSTDLIRYYRE